MTELQGLPPVFSAIPDPRDPHRLIKLSCRPSDDTRKLHLMAVTVDNVMYTNTFDQADLQRIKAATESGGAAVPWVAFWRDIERSFNNKDVQLTVNTPSLTCVATVAGRSAQFVLPKATGSDSGNGSMQLVDMLYPFYELRHSATPEGQLNELEQKHKSHQSKVSALESEKSQLKETLQSMENEHEALVSQYGAIEEELREVKRSNGGDADEGEAVDLLLEEPIEPDLSGVCLARVPLGDTKCRKYDEELLRLIKSTFCPLDQQAPSDRMVQVIRPYLSSEFRLQMERLPDNARGIVMGCMKHIDQWDYDIWRVQDFTERGALFHTGYTLFMRHNLLKTFNLDEQVVINFLSQIEAGYHPNPYHNAMHGADVLHVIHYICAPGGLRDTAKLTDADVFAALIAGMIHDYDHPGLNNNFHVKVQSYLASLYNDRSILENHHCAEVFELMKAPQFNILEPLRDELRRDIRETVIEMVLSTDMGLHAKIFGSWKRRIAQDHDLYKRKDDQRLALSITIKMADISNCGRPETLYLRWANKLAEEFFLQGDNERNRNDPVSPFMDRFSPSMAKSQIAFMNYIVIPMFESIAEYLPDMHFSVDHCEANKSYWSSHDDSVP